MQANQENNATKSVLTSLHAEAGSRNKASETHGITISTYSNSRRTSSRTGNKNTKRNEVQQNCESDLQELQQKVSTELISNNVCTKVSNENKQCDFSEPMLLTSMKIIDSLHSLGGKTSQTKSQSSHSESGPCKKVLQKVNFPFEEKVYKGFIDLKVSDEHLGINSNIPFKAKEIVKIKEPEPVLSDYYTPSFNREYIIKPKIPTFEVPKLTVPEISSVFQATRQWEPEELY